MTCSLAQALLLSLLISQNVLLWDGMKVVQRSGRNPYEGLYTELVKELAETVCTHPTLQPKPINRGHDQPLQPCFPSRSLPQFRRWRRLPLLQGLLNASR